MADIYEGYANSLTTPAVGHEDIIPSDTEDLKQVTKQLFIGASGDLRIMALDGTIATYSGLPGGSILNLRVKRVLATGTRADFLVAMY